MRATADETNLATKTQSRLKLYQAQQPYIGNSRYFGATLTTTGTFSSGRNAEEVSIVTSPLVNC
jgi:hypothetical protein